MPPNRWRRFVIRGGVLLVLSATIAVLYLVGRPSYLRPFCFDPEQPFSVEFGTYSAFEATVTLFAIESDGRIGDAMLQRPVAAEGTQSTGILSAAQTRQIASMIERSALQDFECNYESSRSEITLHVLRVRQGRYQKTVACYEPNDSWSNLEWEIRGVAAPVLSQVPKIWIPEGKVLRRWKDLETTIPPVPDKQQWSLCEWLRKLF
jgi:hypothetical protein